MLCVFNFIYVFTHTNFKQLMFHFGIFFCCVFYLFYLSSELIDCTEILVFDGGFFKLKKIICDVVCLLLFVRLFLYFLCVFYTSWM